MDPKLTEVSQLFERLKPLLFGMISILVPNSSLSSRGDICEHAVVLSVKIEDQGAFERDFFFQLKPYYTDAQ
ncbi:unnamed protein product [Camellia sinensis]